MRRAVIVLFIVLSSACILLLHIPKEEKPSRKPYARELLQRLSPTEHKFLTCLCKELLYTSTFGYTLFGNKPLSLTIDGSRPGLDTKFIFLKFAIPLLCKHEKSLNSQNFMVLLEINEELPFIYLVNKRAFVKAVRENITIFQNVLGSDITPEGLLRDIEEKKCELGTAIKKNHALFGILFGFGTQNALAFDYRCQIENFIQNQGFPPWKDPHQNNLTSIGEIVILNDTRKGEEPRMKTVTPEGRAPSSEIRSYEQKLAELNNKLEPAGGACPHWRLVSSITPPCFASNPEYEETARLVKEYRAEQAHLTQLLNDERLLEMVLDKFFEPVEAE
jgi:hypothetical protein